MLEIHLLIDVSIEVVLTKHETGVLRLNSFELAFGQCLLHACD